MPITLTRHIIEEQAGEPATTGEFAAIMAQFALAAKLIARDMSHAGLIDVLGVTGDVNVQGEAVQKLDQKANESFIRAFEYSGSVRTLISEEMEKPLHVGGQLPTGMRHGNYALFFDPLDGSSNVDVNGVVGSIFSVHRRTGCGRVRLIWSEHGVGVHQGNRGSSVYAGSRHRGVRALERLSQNAGAWKGL